MKTCEYQGAELTLRSHPWTSALHDTTCRYYDFRTSPQLIRSSLEDFTPWNKYAAIQDFYSLLERLNHAKSPLESNDCELTGPTANLDVQFRKSLQCSGRLMLLYRDTELNVVKQRVFWLKMALHQQLAHLDSKFQWGVIGTTLVPVHYLALANEEVALGQQLMISFWAFGNSEAETMLSLSRVFKNLTQALREVSARVAAG
jgi:hypothetical protein